MSQKKQVRARGKSGGGMKNRNALWLRKQERARPLMVALIALICVVAIVVGYLMQSSTLFNKHAAAQPVQSAIRLSEIMSENGATLLNGKGEAPDWIEIENIGYESVNLAKYSLLVDSNINKVFVFPDVTIAPGEYLVIYAEGSDAASSGNALSAPFRLAASGGDTVVLLNPQGTPIDSVTTPELGMDEVYCRNEDDAWQISGAATPGRRNEVSDAVDGSTAKVPVQRGAVEISEVMSSNTIYCPDESGERHDYVELHNTSDTEVNLEGWYLSDSSEKLKRWSFPSVKLPAGGYLVVHCSGYDRRGNVNHLHTNFKLSSAGESVYLSNADGQTVSAVELPALVNGQAYSYFDGAWSTQMAPTPGMANTQENAAALNAQRFGAAAGVYINEVMASPSSQKYDWVEIYNGSSQAVDLGGYGLTDDAARPRKWQFPAGTIIQPGQYLGVYLSGTTVSMLEGFLNADFALNVEGGYTMALSTPDGSILDALYLPRQYGGISYGRVSGESGCFYFAEGTPGTANSASRYRGRAELAQYSVRGGLFRSGQAFTVELSAAPGSRIYYTLDCSDPDQSSTLYTGPISISSTTILRTRVYRDGYMESYMDTQSYLYDVGNEGSVRVVSLVTDWDNLTSQERGIMVKGPNALPDFPYGSMNKGANFWMDWEREAHVELFLGNGEQVLSQECGIKLHGQYSRAADVKAFKVIARSEYGSSRFEYPIFTERDYGEYQSFLLRASGQDYNRTFMRDSVLTTLAKDTSVMYQESEVCVCYINGQYYSLMYLRERINTHSICQFEGWEGMEDDLDLVKANNNVMQGSNDTYAALIDFLKANKNNLNSQEVYERINAAIDLQNYIEYMAIEIFVGNGDTLNVKRYRNAKTDGKWRWVLFDLDWAFDVDTNSIRRWLDPQGMGTNKYTRTELFIACMVNDTIRERFLTYFGQQLATTFSTEAMMAKFEARYDLIDGLLPEYLAKLGMSQDKYNKQLKELVDYAQTRPTKILEYFDGVFEFTDAQKQQYFGDAVAKIQAWTNAQGGA